MTMHSGELPIDERLVARLVAEQFPDYAGLPVRAVPSTGTVNAIFRLGNALCARLPRLRSWARDLEREVTWLPHLAPRVSLRIPQPVGRGRPTRAYPCWWAIYRWIEGAPYRDDLVGDECGAATTLAQFVTELQRVDPASGPPAGRAPLRELDAVTRAAIEASRSVVDADAALAVWEAALETPVWDGRPVWIHADLLRPNLLVNGGRLRAVIDFGSAGLGDPAMDLVAAWSVLGAAGRVQFRVGCRAASRVDDAAWARARGYALHQAALIVPYYLETNPRFAAEAMRTISEVLSDGG
jgi:aminoglycoside phosphotransferase (APT) family kinase protein